jgi:three-Cys-motif partner protein
MATGTSGGLLDDPEGHAQSVFKHAILSKYMLPFVAMVGSASSGRRMVVLDGYAGRGRYRGGEPGSAELILQVIKNFRDSRQVLAYFVENSAFALMRPVIAARRATEAFSGRRKDGSASS